MLLGIKALGVTFTDVIELIHQKTSLKKKNHGCENLKRFFFLSNLQNP